MPIQIVKVSSKAQLRRFIDFPEKLYKNCENWVPALRGDEFDTFNKNSNPAYEFCESECYLAMDGEEIVGRVAAIINHKANKNHGERAIRFGWLDFIEDIDVLKALIDAVQIYGHGHQCTLIKGPLGFTDMDKEGLLIDGYENLSPFTCLYNFPYYGRMLEEIGFTKEVDWTQKLVKIDANFPSMFRLADKIEQRYGLRCVRMKSMYQIGKKYGMDIFHHVYNEAFAPLFQFSPLTDRQIKRYLQTYIPILDPDFVAVCVNEEDKPIGFAFCVPSISKAVKKSGGRLLPFGIFRILRALKKNDTLEALMIGVHPDYQGKGAVIPMIKFLHENALKRGISRLLLNPELEDNFKVQTLFDEYEGTPYMRRRSYTKPM